MKHGDVNGCESVAFLVVGCGPAGATAAREAARRGVATLVLERDAVVGEKRVCAAGLRPGFCETFDLPRSLVHCDTPRLALFDAAGAEHEVFFGPGHTTTREELDGTMGALALRSGAEVRTRALFRSVEAADGGARVEYADLATGQRRFVSTRHVFFATGASARLDAAAFGRLAEARWRDGLMTTLQYRVYLARAAAPVAYRTLEMHYYPARDGRQIIGWMFPKRDHLAIGLGVMGKIDGASLRAELDALEGRVRERLYPGSDVLGRKQEGSLLYGGMPRPGLDDGALLVGGTAAGLVDATNGEGIYEAAMSGRIAADCVARQRNRAGSAGGRYAALVNGRFARRLSHRVRLMRYLERRPARFAALFEQLARTPRLTAVLHMEDCERTMSDRLYLYRQALRFGIRTLACRE
ncbi:MAG TPA: NAD(P)/FAD-dependent oxidoreductase [Candidatus Cybelea sp.]|nr:NAD(P)/FAD-dependent oxidoreductase [Candidatus Cybelea sp.]